MSSKIRTIVTFRSSAFNTNDPKDYFINPCCFGDDVANWLIGELRKLGVKTDDQPGQEDFGWYLNLSVAEVSHTFVMLFRPDDGNGQGAWIGWLERNRNFIGSVFGARSRGIDPVAAETLHRVLVSSSLVRDVRWHFPREFNRGLEEPGAASPSLPT
jgi:hypothetical protein